MFNNMKQRKSDDKKLLKILFIEGDAVKSKRKKKPKKKWERVQKKEIISLPAFEKNEKVAKKNRSIRGQAKEIGVSYHTQSHSAQ